MATTNEAVIKALKAFRAFLNRLEKDRAPNMFGGRGGGTNVSIDLAETDRLLQEIIDKLLTAPSTEAKQDDNIVQNNAVNVSTAASRIIQGDILTQLGDAGALSIAEWLEDIEADVDGIEGLLTTLVAENATSFALLTAGIIVDAAATVLILLDIIVRALSDVARNSKLDDIVASNATINTSLNAIEADTGTMDSSLNEIESAIENIETVAGFWQPMSIGEAVTAGFCSLTKTNGDGTWAVSSTHNLRYQDDAVPSVAFNIQINFVNTCRITGAGYQMNTNGNSVTLAGDKRNLSMSLGFFNFWTATTVSKLSPLDGTSAWIDCHPRNRILFTSNAALAADERFDVDMTVFVWIPAV